MGGMLMIFILCIFLCLLCGLCNRFAGGLLSKLVGKDLGDFLPRQIWGFSAGFSAGIIALYECPDLLKLWYFYLMVIVASVLTGLLRGIGWGNSLTVGFGSNGLDKSLAKKQWPVFFLHAAGMNAGVMILQIFTHTSITMMIVMTILAIVCAGLGWLEAYIFAFLKPLNIPKLGMFTTDPPPTGEFLAGMMTIIIFTIFCVL